MRKYAIWTFDVWGNAEDGYEVNDRHKLNASISLPNNPTKEDIFWAIQPYVRGLTKISDFQIDGDEEVITIDDKSDFPLFSLEAI